MNRWIVSYSATQAETKIATARAGDLYDTNDRLSKPNRLT
jgi:hypothetical protein